MDRGLDMLWVGLNTTDKDHAATVEAFKNGVKDYVGKYSFV